MYDNGQQELLNASFLRTGRRYIIGKGWCFIEQIIIA
jgi:hypothetical protein